MQLEVKDTIANIVGCLKNPYHPHGKKKAPWFKIITENESFIPQQTDGCYWFETDVKLYFLFPTKQDCDMDENFRIKKELILKACKDLITVVWILQKYSDHFGYEVLTNSNRIGNFYDSPNCEVGKYIRFRLRKCETIKCDDKCIDVEKLGIPETPLWKK